MNEGVASDSLVEATEAMAAAFAHFAEEHRRVLALAVLRARREWTAQEFGSYLELARAERMAERRYLVARRRFDALRRRARRRPVRTAPL